MVLRDQHYIKQNKELVALNLSPSVDFENLLAFDCWSGRNVIDDKERWTLCPKHTNKYILFAAVSVFSREFCDSSLHL